MKESDIDPYEDLVKTFERLFTHVSAIDNVQQLLFIGLLCERLAQKVTIRLKFMKHKADMPST